MDKGSAAASQGTATITLEEVVGAAAYGRKDKGTLYRAIKADKFVLSYFGPPGTRRRRQLAKVIANTTSAVFTRSNTTVAGKGHGGSGGPGQRKENLGHVQKKTIFSWMRFTGLIKASRIICSHSWRREQDHYFNDAAKSYFEVNGALISHSSIFGYILWTRKISD